MHIVSSIDSVFFDGLKDHKEPVRQGLTVSFGFFVMKTQRISYCIPIKVEFYFFFFILHAQFMLENCVWFYQSHNT